MTASSDASAPISLALHIEGDAADVGALLAEVPEVATVDHVSTSDNRDLATIATTLVTLTTIAANASMLIATVDKVIDQLKAIAKKRGWKISVEVGRKNVDVHSVTAEQKETLAQPAS